MPAAARVVEPTTGILKDTFLHFNACHTRTVKGHVLPTGDRSVGVTGTRVVAPTTLGRALRGYDQLDRLLRRFF